MIEKIISAILLFIVGIAKVAPSGPQLKNTPLTSIKNSPSKSPVNPNMLKSTLSRGVFIPYWGQPVKMNTNGPTFDSYYYFGIQPTKEGTLENEVGLQNMSIVDSIPKKQKKVVLRMLDPTISESLLGDKRTQKILISNIKQVLTKNSFSGLLIDLEVPFTLQAYKKGQITEFVQLVCTEIKSDYKTCGILIYGDFAYRNRPYDLKALGAVVDTVLFMAYDFHKASGEPGPNFPFDRRSPKGEGGSDVYTYDFKQMISDATALVPKQKIEVVFGMYGYDWTLNKQGTPLKSAIALSVESLNIKVKSEGLKVQSNESREKYIKYLDVDGLVHIIWYEDEESAVLKTKYLLEEGIGKVSFWAQSYF